jgi:hypothetical protein
MGSVALLTQAEQRDESGPEFDESSAQELVLATVVRGWNLREPHWAK